MGKCFALLAALVSFSCAAPAPPASAAPRPRPPAIRFQEPEVIDRPRADLIKKLDEMVQWRFSSIIPEDVRTRRLGISRMAPRPAVPVHTDELAVLSGRDPLGSEGWAAAVYAVRAREESTIPGRVRGPVSAGGGTWTATEDRRAVEELAHRAITSRAPVSGASHGIPIEARVVPASAPICLNCHVGKEVGEPVGAVVYAFHRERPSVTTPGRESGR
jgi:hypothetical protein